MPDQHLHPSTLGTCQHEDLRRVRAKTSFPGTPHKVPRQLPAQEVEKQSPEPVQLSWRRVPASLVPVLQLCVALRDSTGEAALTHATTVALARLTDVCANKSSVPRQSTPMSPPHTHNSSPTLPIVYGTSR